MASLIPLSLTIITVVLLGAPQFGAGESSTTASAITPHQILTLMNTSEGGSDWHATSGGDVEEMEEDMPARPSKPTNLPWSFLRATKNNRPNSQLTFGEAIVLAKYEAQCFKDYGSKKGTAALSPNGALAESLLIPYGCYKPESALKCEQCRHISTQPISTTEECQDLCEPKDEFCNSKCSQLLETLRRDVPLYDFAHSKLSQPEMQTNGIHSLWQFNDSDAANNVTHAPDDILSGIQYHNSSLKAEVEILRDYLQPDDGTQRKAQTHLIHSPEVFCEGVNAMPNSGQIHFVLLKWNINESPLLRGDDEIATSDSKPGFPPRMTNGREREPLVFVIEQQTGNSSKWKTIGKTTFGLQTVNVSYHTNTYKWRITAVDPNGIQDAATTEGYATLDGYVNPGPPKRIFVVDTEVKNSSANVLIGWEPPDEKACFYKIVLEDVTEAKTETVRIKDQPLGVHMYWFENLKFRTVYHVRMTTRNSSWKYESNHTKLEFTTPTCLEAYNYRFDKCAPPPPRDIRSVIETVKAQSHSTPDAPKVQVTLTWQPPLHTSETNSIEKYVVEIRPTDQKGNFTELTKSYKIPGNTTRLSLKALEPDTGYTVMIAAYSTLGRSPGAPHQFNTRLVLKAELTQEPLGNWVYVTATFITAIVILVICNMIRIYIHRRNVKIARNHYFQSMEERDDATGADWSIIPLTDDDSSNWKLFDENFPRDKWEIAWDQLTMGEVIGQGAFGVVRRAKIQRKKLEAKLKFRGDDQVWFNSGDRNLDSDSDMETVAVKMVKVSATRDDREQLIKEITMMQSLGIHSQIVGLLGACTRGRTLCLVLEYCPGGDLLTFVRKVRAKYWPTLGLAGIQTPRTGSQIGKSPTIIGMQLCSGGRTNSGSGGGSDHSSSNFGSASENKKSTDNSPINYADIGGFSESCSSPEASFHGFQEPLNSNRETTGNSARTDNSNPPPFVSANEIVDDDEDFRPIDERDVLSYARQIAMGMEYLEKNRLIHRDLALRNVLVMGDYKHVKISDFGLSRDIYTWNVYHQKSNGKLPIKWMAIESIFTHVFTTKSDVWSYGILLWELVTLGGTPYPGLGNTELFHLLKSGYRMERPDNCSEELYAVMKKCWRTAAASRPSFTELRRHIEMMMEAAEPNLYLSLMADLPTDYFQLSSRSDIPIVCMDGENTPRDSPTTNGFPSYPPRTGTMSPAEGNSCLPPKYKGNNAGFQVPPRKSHPVYHNTRYKNTAFESPSNDDVDMESSIIEEETGIIPEIQQHSLTSAPLRVPSRASSRGTRNSSDFTIIGESSSPRDDSFYSSFSKNNHTPNSTKLIREKALRRLSLGSHSEADHREAAGLLRIGPNDSSLCSDSGIQMEQYQRSAEVELLCDSEEQVNGDEEVEAGQEDNECNEDKSGLPLLTISRNGGCRSLPQSPTAQLPVLKARGGSTRGTKEVNAKRGQHWQQYMDSGAERRAKLKLPFVNINDMTIIENRTYDLRDT